MMVSNIFKQLEYLGFEDTMLSAPVNAITVSFSNPYCTLEISTPKSGALSRQKLELLRAFFVFYGIFYVKPSVIRLSSGAIKLVFTFRNFNFVKIVKILYKIRFTMRSKLLSFYDSESFSFSILKEPLSFFPLVHPKFDYHDWSAPFTFYFRVNSSCVSGFENSKNTIDKIFII
jgi:hypothetical protein